MGREPQPENAPLRVQPSDVDGRKQTRLSSEQGIQPAHAGRRRRAYGGTGPGSDDELAKRFGGFFHRGPVHGTTLPASGSRRYVGLWDHLPHRASIPAHDLWRCGYHVTGPVRFQEIAVRDSCARGMSADEDIDAVVVLP
jgi:hypothetical protein